MQPWYGTARLPRTTSVGARSSRAQVPATNESEVHVLQLVQDAYSYMGYTQLVKYISFLLIGILMLLMHVSTLNATASTTYFRSSVTSHLVSRPAGTTGLAWQDVDSFYSAARFYRAFLESAIAESTKQGLGPGFVKVGEYGNVTYARIVVNFLENCRLKAGHPTQEGLGSRCILNAEPGVRQPFHVGQSFGQATLFKYMTWHDSPAAYYRFRTAEDTSTDWSALVVVGNVSTSERPTYTNKLRLHMSDGHLALLSRYAYSIGLDLVAANTLCRDDYAIFSLRAQRSSGGSGVDADAFQKLSITTPGKRNMYATPRDRARTALEVVFWLAFFWLVSLDYAQWRLARRQGCSFRHFISTPWNAYAWAVNAVLLAWLTSYLVLLARWNARHRYSHWPGTPLRDEDLYRLQYFPAQYEAWVYWGIAVMLLVGMRTLQFTRMHRGLNVFHDVFVKTARDLADFAAVFVFLLCLLASCFFLVFQVSGGNPNWVTWSHGAGVLARVAFHFGDWGEVYNSGAGLGRYAWVVAALFWLSVVALVVWCGNVFIAAVCHAYSTVRNRSQQVEVFFLWELLLRLFSALAHTYWMLLGSHIQRRREPPGEPPTPLTLTQHFNILYDNQQAASAEPLAPNGGPPPSAPAATAAPSALPTRLSTSNGFEVVWHSNNNFDLLDTGDQGPQGGQPGANGVVTPGFVAMRKEQLLRNGSQQQAQQAQQVQAQQAHAQANGTEPLMPLGSSAPVLPLLGAAGSGDSGRGALQMEKARSFGPSLGLGRLKLGGRQRRRSQWRWECGCGEGVDAWWHLTDIRFYDTLLPEVPQRNPRWYLLARWAVARRPEMRALAVYFTDFRTYSLAGPHGPYGSGGAWEHRSSNDSAVNGGRPSVLRHLPAAGERVGEEWVKHGVPEVVTRTQLLELLEEVQRAHAVTLAAVRMWFFPMFLTKYLLGYFWRDCVHATIRTAIKRVYNPRHLKEIEFSFAVEEDDACAAPTLRDLQSRVQEPVAAIGQRTASLEARLRKMEGMLTQLLQRVGGNERESIRNLQQTSSGSAYAGGPALGRFVDQV